MNQKDIIATLGFIFIIFSMYLNENIVDIFADHDIANRRILKIQRKDIRSLFHRSCYFNFHQYIILSQYVDTTSCRHTGTPNIVWSHFQHDIYGSLLPTNATADSYTALPYYPMNVIAELRSVYINLIAGAFYNSSGCLAGHLQESHDWPRRRNYMKKYHSVASLRSSEVFDSDSAIYLWGSIYSSDWQHAVIDFLPLFDWALTLVHRIASQNASTISSGRFALPIVAGSYARFFEGLYPFSLFQFVHRNFRQPYMPTPQGVDPMAFRHVFVVDFLARDQSNLQPGSYRRILPFLSAGFRFDPAVHDMAFLLRHIAADQEPAAAPANIGRKCDEETAAAAASHPPLQQRNLVVFFDRNAIAGDAVYRRRVGQPNGRQLLNQSSLLAAIASSLLPPYRLQTLTCMDWKTDRAVVARAAVLIGVHGGALVNMIFAAPGTHVIEIGRSVIMRAMQMQRLRQRRANASTSPSPFPPLPASKNPRLVFAGMAASLGHVYWTAEDLMAVRAVQQQSKKANRKPGWAGPDWSDGPVRVDNAQIVDTLVKIGVAANNNNNKKKNG